MKFLSQEQIELGYSLADNAAQAAIAISVSPATFKRYAIKYGLYKTNQGGRGSKKPSSLRIDTNEFLKIGTHINSSGLKKRLLDEGLKTNQCEDCGQLPFWNGKPLVLHLDHVNGDNTDNRLANLRILCPHCHSQTSTYCRGQGKYKRT